MNKYQQKSPTPLTPADEAWEKMLSMLDSEIPSSNQQSKKRVFTISFSQLAISLVAALIFVGGGTYITLKSLDNKKEIYITKHLVKQQKLNSHINKTILTVDSTLSLSIDPRKINSTDQKVDLENMPQQHNSINQISVHAPISKTNNSQNVISGKKTNFSNVPVDSTGQMLKKMIGLKDPLVSYQKITNIDSIAFDNSKMYIILQKNEIIANATLKAKTNLIDYLKTDKNLTTSKLLTTGEKKKENVVSNYSKNNYLFVGLSGNNGFLFVKNTTKNMYSYGEILTIGIRNIKYNVTVESGIGFQSLEYHMPYSRKLYIYQATGIYDSTTTASSYKYSRHSIVIPFFITKEIYRYNDICLDVKTGVNATVFLSKQRLFNQLPTDILSIESSNPTNNFNLSFLLSPQFRWDINNKLSFNINAGGIIYLNSLYRNYSIKPIGINLSAGIYYNF